VKRTIATSLLTAVTLVLAACGGSTSAGGSGWEVTPLSSQVKALEGMRARNLDSEMNRLGFTNVGGYKTDNASITTWWNPRDEQCVSVTTRDGRATSIEPLYAGNCR
jgi:hypothetical protein